MTRALAQRHAKPESTGRAEDLTDEDLLEQFLNGDAYASQEAFRSWCSFNTCRQVPSTIGPCRATSNRNAS